MTVYYLVHNNRRLKKTMENVVDYSTACGLREARPHPVDHPPRTSELGEGAAGMVLTVLPTHRHKNFKAHIQRCGLHTSALAGHCLISPTDSHLSFVVVSQCRHDGVFPSGSAVHSPIGLHHRLSHALSLDSFRNV